MYRRWLVGTSTSQLPAPLRRTQINPSLYFSTRMRMNLNWPSASGALQVRCWTGRRSSIDSFLGRASKNITRASRKSERETSLMSISRPDWGTTKNLQLKHSPKRVLNRDPMDWRHSITKSDFKESSIIPILWNWKQFTTPRAQFMLF